MSRTIPLFCLFTAGTLAACRDEPTATAFPAVETSAAASITPEPQRAKWRFKLAGDYSAHSPGIGADGTVYVGLSNGKLYAIAPDGAQRWVVQSGLGGGVYGPVSVGADGTIYVAGLAASPSGTGNTGAIFAYTPAGTRKWMFNATNQIIMAGPNVGPDGNIYAVTRFSGIGLFSLTPAGQLRFSAADGFSQRGPLGEAIAFGANQLYFAFDMYGTGNPSTLFGYDFNGGQRFRAFNTASHAQPAVGPNGNVVVETFPTGVGLSLAAYSPAGAQQWSFYEFPGNTEEHPDVGPDNVAYTVRNLSYLFALNPNGTETWRFFDPTIMFEPKVRPQNDLLFMGGRLNYGEPGFFQAVSSTGAALWRVDLPTEPGFAPYGQLVPMTRPVFSPDGSTGYGVTDVAGDGASANKYSFLYAIDLGATPPPPTNAKPVATLVATTATTIAVGGSITVRSSFTDPDNGPWSYQFRWGNGRTGGTASAAGSIIATRTYATAGTFGIKFFVTDAKGAADTSNVVRVTVK